ncbi:putative AIPR protein [Bacillus phage vB_BmeM-Goe8]|uniref:Putative AIPR protein n=1 Tax=Bacillus phage vB_BmeM-Goe8 TaxID=2593638 RepID=A0A516KMW9_9CAUD|nr:putative AIPR protein [Bacillus phage vB_BmeM-Goe8]QDP42941.1 putative AIPR protein [Bacillus phage vB_BmeM-Goe8]
MTNKTIELEYINAAELEPGYIVLTISAEKLKGMDISLNANPRKPSKANKNVKAMIAQLETDPQNFRRKNEGISIIAHEAVIDSPSRKVVFELNERQGIINGGHTFYTLSNYGVKEATVRIEINTGVPDQLTTDIASARNASKKLSVESELHHIGLFDWIKDSVSPEMKADIKFFEGDEGTVDVGELLQVANVINPTKRTIDNAKRSYNSRGGILGDLKRHGVNASIVRTRGHLEDMWKLYTYIRTDEDLRDRFTSKIFENNQTMYKGVAFFLLAAALLRRTEMEDGLVKINAPLSEIERIVYLKAQEIDNHILKLGEHFISNIDSMVASETFVVGVEVVFLR